jgi:hypothetical protein
MNAFEHEHEWIETERTASKEGITIKKHCDGCGLRMAIGPGKLEREPAKIEIEEEEFQRRVIETVVADLKANGKIRLALLGL